VVQTNESAHKLIDKFRTAISTGLFSSLLKEASVVFKATNLTTVSVSPVVVFSSIQLIITSFAPTISPTTTYTVVLSDQNKSSFPLTMVIGVCGGVVILCIPLCVGYYFCYRRSGEDEDDSKDATWSNKKLKKKKGAAVDGDIMQLSSIQWDTLEDADVNNDNDDVGSDGVDPQQLRAKFGRSRQYHENPKSQKNKILAFS